jgi:N-acetylglutamate synthase/N-acetylornithine aminotransferase
LDSPQTKGLIMALIAKTEPGGAAGLVWEKAGDEGAIEVHPRLAQELLNIPGELFYVVVQTAKQVVKDVEKEVTAVEAEVKKAVTKKAAEKPAEEVAPAADIAEAIDTASPTKRRSNKE